MFRKLISIAAAAGFAVIAYAGAANAVSSVSLEWDSTGTTTITISTAVATQTEKAWVVMTGDAAGVSGVGVTFEYDNNLNNEMDHVGGREFGLVNLPGMGNSFSPAQQGFLNTIEESSTSQLGRIGTFDQVAINGALINGTVTLGSVVFSINTANVVNDGTDIAIVIHPGSPDGIVDAVGANITGQALLGGLVVNAPEPAIAALSLAALATLGGLVARRRQQR